MQRISIESLSLQKKSFLKRILENTETYVLVLQQKDDPAIKIVMRIGKHEATELAIAIEQMHTSRPVPGETLATVIKELGFTLTSVLIDELKDGIYHSKMCLTKGEDTKTIDCRPTESLAQSLLFNCGIFVSQNVIGRSKV